MNEVPIYVEDLIYNLLVKGYVPIIAHPERYTKISEDPNILYKYISMGALAQLNLPSLAGFYGSRVKNTAEVLLKHNMIHFVATDSHSNRHRSPNVEEGLKRLYDLVGDEYFELLTEGNQESVLNDKPIQVFQPIKVSGRKKGLGIFAALFARY